MKNFTLFLLVASCSLASTLAQHQRLQIGPRPANSVALVNGLTPKEDRLQVRRTRRPIWRRRLQEKNNGLQDQVAQPDLNDLNGPASLKNKVDEAQDRIFFLRGRHRGKRPHGYGHGRPNYGPPKKQRPRFRKPILVKPRPIRPIRTHHRPILRKPHPLRKKPIRPSYGGHKLKPTHVKPESGDSYGPPQNKPSSVDEYGSPQGDVASVDEYGSPQGEAQGLDEYGSPHGETQSLDEYGFPQEDSSFDSYGSPESSSNQDSYGGFDSYGNPVQDEYGSPQGNVQDEYTPDFEPPASYNAEIQNEISGAEEEFSFPQFPPSDFVKNFFNSNPNFAADGSDDNRLESYQVSEEGSQYSDPQSSNDEYGVPYAGVDQTERPSPLSSSRHPTPSESGASVSSGNRYRQPQSSLSNNSPSGEKNPQQSYSAPTQDTQPQSYNEQPLKSVNSYQPPRAPPSNSYQSPKQTEQSSYSAPSQDDPAPSYVDQPPKSENSYQPPRVSPSNSYQSPEEPGQSSYSVPSSQDVPAPSYNGQRPESENSYTSNSYEAPRDSEPSSYSGPPQGATGQSYEEPAEPVNSYKPVEQERPSYSQQSQSRPPRPSLNRYQPIQEPSPRPSYSQGQKNSNKPSSSLNEGSGPVYYKSVGSPESLQSENSEPGNNGYQSPSNRPRPPSSYSQNQADDSRPTNPRLPLQDEVVYNRPLNSQVSNIPDKNRPTLTEPSSSGYSNLRSSRPSYSQSGNSQSPKTKPNNNNNRQPSYSSPSSASYGQRNPPRSNRPSYSSPSPQRPTYKRRRPTNSESSRKPSYGKSVPNPPPNINDNLEYEEDEKAGETRPGPVYPAVPQENSDVEYDNDNANPSTPPIPYYSSSPLNNGDSDFGSKARPSSFDGNSYSQSVSNNLQGNDNFDDTVGSFDSDLEDFKNQSPLAENLNFNDASENSYNSFSSTSAPTPGPVYIKPLKNEDQSFQLNGDNRGNDGSKYIRNREPTPAPTPGPVYTKPLPQDDNRYQRPNSENSQREQSDIPSYGENRPSFQNEQVDFQEEDAQYPDFPNEPNFDFSGDISQSPGKEGLDNFDSINEEGFSAYESPSGPITQPPPTQGPVYTTLMSTYQQQQQQNKEGEKNGEENQGFPSFFKFDFPKDNNKNGYSRPSASQSSNPQGNGNGNIDSGRYNFDAVSAEDTDDYEGEDSYGIPQSEPVNDYSAPSEQEQNQYRGSNSPVQEEEEEEEEEPQFYYKPLSNGPPSEEPKGEPDYEFPESDFPPSQMFDGGSPDFNPRFPSYEDNPTPPYPSPRPTEDSPQSYNGPQDGKLSYREPIDISSMSFNDNIKGNPFASSDEELYDTRSPISGRENDDVSFEMSEPFFPQEGREQPAPVEEQQFEQDEDPVFDMPDSFFPPQEERDQPEESGNEGEIEPTFGFFAEPNSFAPEEPFEDDEAAAFPNEDFYQSDLSDEEDQPGSRAQTTSSPFYYKELPPPSSLNKDDATPRRRSDHRGYHYKEPRQMSQEKSKDYSDEQDDDDDFFSMPWNTPNFWDTFESEWGKKLR